MKTIKTTFSVEGPFEIPCYKGKACQIITADNAKTFWKNHSSVGAQRGCYVFGIRAGKGWTPGYVGKAAKCFKQEVFAYQKLAYYQQFLADYLKGSPVLFFLVCPNKKGPTNVAHIKELEDFLIQVAVIRNPDLLNVKGTKKEEWGIAGVLRGGQGKPNRAARRFRKSMKI